MAHLISVELCIFEMQLSIHRHLSKNLSRSAKVSLDIFINLIAINIIVLTHNADK